MAEESKSWFPNLGLLSESSLTGLSPEVQDQLQRESVKRMFIGGLLSGRPDIGFQSAVGVPNDYFARQQQINAQNQLAGISRAAAASTTPTTMGVSAGSPQAQMLEQDVRDFGPDAARTASALYSNPNLPREINKPLYAKNVSQILAATSPKDWAEFEKNVRPQAMEPGSVITDPFNPSKVISQLPGGLEKGMQWGVNPVTGKTEVQLMPGFATGIAERTRAETTARELNTPRPGISASGAQTFVYPQAPNGVGGSGVIEPVQTEADRIRLEADKKRFGEFSAQSSDAALNATDRKLAGERIYSLADSINGTKFTNLTSEAAGYLRALPWVGDKFDSYVADVSLFNRDRANMVLRGLSNVKGNANESENRVVSQASVSVTDPKVATKYVAALEMAAADKDLARQNFVENFKGDPGKIQTAWQNSPDNPRIYNHSKVDQFLTEQIKTNPAKPVLPAGFSLVQNKDKQYGVRKPDGSVMPLQMGQ